MRPLAVDENVVRIEICVIDPALMQPRNRRADRAP